MEKENSPEDQSHEFQILKEQVAKLEAKFASSWALQTKDDFDKSFKDNMKDYINSYINKYFISAIVILTGAGFLFIKSAISGAIMDRSAGLIKEFQAEHSQNINYENRLFDWQRFHDYGKNYIYLAEMYANSNVTDSLKHKKINDCLQNALTYFNYALAEDPKQASSYWEIGEIYYTHSRKYAITNVFNKEKAIRSYMDAIEMFSPEEVNKGWRADAYRCLGKISLEGGDSKKNGKAESFLLKALNEYKAATIESHIYNKKSIEEVQQLLLKFK